MFAQLLYFPYKISVLMIKIYKPSNQHVDLQGGKASK